MNIILNSLQYTIPSIIVLITSYLIVKSFLDKEYQRQRHELHMNNNKLITPIRLQSYERMLMFLERISPYSLIPRVQSSGLSGKQFQTLLVQNVRSEFEHNLSQQIYISNETWDLVKIAKENLIKLINIAAGHINENATALDLSKVILDMYLKAENLPINIAIDSIKEEFKSIFLD
ncbi:MAG: hypothetical protein JXR51_13975 [Bacteroidales bacterium]|nr:hypothetical protein [Bacteroidales bacterium]MBN2758276.1 hypothetical protein [Bacteroidales bacterium]